jgi:putative endonuclease
VSRGKFFEEKAAEFLKIKGYRILKRNFRSVFGEIDIIALRDDVVSFVEVKGRKANTWVYPREALSKDKIKKIKKTALFYIADSVYKAFNFDLVEIIEGCQWRQYSIVEYDFCL